MNRTAFFAHPALRRMMCKDVVTKEMTVFPKKHFVMMGALVGTLIGFSTGGRFVRSPRNFDLCPFALNAVMK